MSASAFFVLYIYLPNKEPKHLSTLAPQSLSTSEPKQFSVKNLRIFITWHYIALLLICPNQTATECPLLPPSYCKFVFLCTCTKCSANCRPYSSSYLCGLRQYSSSCSCASTCYRSVLKLTSYPNYSATFTLGTSLRYLLSLNSGSYPPHFTRSLLYSPMQFACNMQT